MYLEDGTAKVMIVGRGSVFQNDEKETVYTDYVGGGYPEGIDPENGLYFNQENIDKVVFRGYKDEEEKCYLEVYC